MIANDIKQELLDSGFDVDGVVAWPNRQKFYVVGYPAEDLPTVLDFDPVDDPTLNE